MAVESYCINVDEIPARSKEKNLELIGKFFSFLSRLLDKNQVP